MMDATGAAATAPVPREPLFSLQQLMRRVGFWLVHGPPRTFRARNPQPQNGTPLTAPRTVSRPVIAAIMSRDALLFDTRNDVRRQAVRDDPAVRTLVFRVMTAAVQSSLQVAPVSSDDLEASEHAESAAAAAAAPPMFDEGDLLAVAPAAGNDADSESSNDFYVISFEDYVAVVGAWYEALLGTDHCDVFISSSLGEFADLISPEGKKILDKSMMCGGGGSSGPPPATVFAALVPSAASLRDGPAMPGSSSGNNSSVDPGSPNAAAELLLRRHHSGAALSTSSTHGGSGFGSFAPSGSLKPSISSPFAPAPACMSARELFHAVLMFVELWSGAPIAVDRACIMLESMEQILVNQGRLMSPSNSVSQRPSVFAASTRPQPSSFAASDAPQSPTSPSLVAAFAAASAVLASAAAMANSGSVRASVPVCVRASAAPQSPTGVSFLCADDDDKLGESSALPASGSLAAHFSTAAPSVQVSRRGSTASAAGSARRLSLGQILQLQQQLATAPASLTRSPPNTRSPLLGPAAAAAASAQAKAASTSTSGSSGEAPSLRATMPGPATAGMPAASGSSSSEHLGAAAAAAPARPAMLWQGSHAAAASSVASNGSQPSSPVSPASAMSGGGFRPLVRVRRIAWQQHNQGGTPVEIVERMPGLAAATASVFSNAGDGDAEDSGSSAASSTATTTSTLYSGVASTANSVNLTLVVAQQPPRALWSSQQLQRRQQGDRNPASAMSDDDDDDVDDAASPPMFASTLAAHESSGAFAVTAQSLFGGEESSPLLLTEDVALEVVRDGDGAMQQSPLRIFIAAGRRQPASITVANNDLCLEHEDFLFGAEMVAARRKEAAARQEQSL